MSKIECVRKKQELMLRSFRTRKSDCHSPENTIDLVVKKIIPTKLIELKCIRLGSSGSAFLEVTAL